MGCGSSAPRVPAEGGAISTEAPSKQLDTPTNPPSQGPTPTSTIHGSDAATVPGDPPTLRPNTTEDPAFTLFHTIARDGDALRRRELEGCLTAIGMRKSVLALALEPLPEKDKESVVSLGTWWSNINPRSKIVIGSKVRSAGDAASTLLGLACTCASGGQESRDVNPAELRAALESVGFEDEEELGKLLEGATSGEAVSLGKWCACQAAICLQGAQIPLRTHVQDAMESCDQILWVSVPHCCAGMRRFRKS